MHADGPRGDLRRGRVGVPRRKLSWIFPCLPQSLETHKVGPTSSFTGLTWFGDWTLRHGTFLRGKREGGVGSTVSFLFGLTVGVS